MRHSEELLKNMFPDLHINLEHPMGMCCSNKKCATYNRPMTVSEAYCGFKVGDVNDYTTKCLTCQTRFVPRFTVSMRHSSAVATHEAVQKLFKEEDKAEGMSHLDVEEIWCELLSPWTLRKEIYTTIFQDGIAEILSPEFRSFTSNRCVLFWNLIVIFRLTGLPYSFLLSDGDYNVAVPLKPPTNPATSMSSSTPVHKLSPKNNEINHANGQKK